MKQAKRLCESFEPIVDRRSRVLILGSMPGPEALRKQQYYGFDGNHFWTIVPALFGKERPATYEEKIRLVRYHRIALWDVLQSCSRPTAMDADITEPQPNAIPQLIKQYPNIKAIFINGRTAFNFFEKWFGGKIRRPHYYLPSSSPAHAAMSLPKKIEKWSYVKTYLEI